MTEFNGEITVEICLCRFAAKKKSIYIIRTIRIFFLTLSNKNHNYKYVIEITDIHFNLIIYFTDTDYIHIY